MAGIMAVHGLLDIFLWVMRARGFGAHYQRGGACNVVELNPCLQLVSYYLSHQLAYRTATKLLHPCLSLASLWMVPQLWFIFFISASTVLRQFVFSRPRFRFPSGVQWIATLVMELASSTLYADSPISPIIH